MRVFISSFPKMAINEPINWDQILYLVLQISLLYNMLRQKEEEQEREDSLPSKHKKQQRAKQIKKKNANLREITHYFIKVDKPALINKNIPTPDKAAIEEMDKAFNQLLEDEHQLLQQIEEAKIKCERQKDEREYFLTKSRNLIASELKKISEVNRFFKRQNQLKVSSKQHQLSKIREEITSKKEALAAGHLNAFQQYFTNKQRETGEREFNRLSMEIVLLNEGNRIAIEQESCYFAKENWPLLMKRYQPLELIGKGGFSEVYKSYDLYSNQTVAIKLSSVEHLLQGCGNKHEYLKHIKREYEIHKQLHHPNIVRLIEVIELQSAICIVLDYCQGYTLAQYLKIEGNLAESEAKMIIQQMAQVIHYLSSQVPAIIHYDLKPQNIIFNKGMLKVLDFGICKIIDSQHSKMALTSQGVGTYWYLPPETFAPCNPVISNKVDIWSLGIIFYEMLFAKRPFGQSITQTSYFNADTLNPLELFGESVRISQGCKDFILQCLQMDQSLRLDPLLILAHPYFTSKA